MDPNVINETLTYFLLYKEAKMEEGRGQREGGRGKMQKGTIN